MQPFLEASPASWLRARCCSRRRLARSSFAVGAILRSAGARRCGRRAPGSRAEATQAETSTCCNPTLPNALRLQGARLLVAVSALNPVVLEGRHVRLEPLSLSHVEALAAVGLDGDLWQWSPSPLRTPGDVADYVRAALDGQARGDMLPFATVERTSGTVVGATRFGNAALAHRRVEIGWTWVARPWQRTAVNTEAKWLMLRHAFGPLGCHRVELKTDALNERSRRAILRLGAVEEGTLRKHTVTASGRVRDTVYFSITDEEWPRVEAALQAKLSPHAG